MARVWLKIHGLPIAPPRHGDTVDSRFEHHVETILGREQVATAQDDFFANMLFDLGQEFPLAWPNVALLDGSPMNGDSGNANLKSPIKDPKKVVFAFGRVVDTASHLDRYRNLRGDVVACSFNDLECNVGLAKMKPATTTPKDFFDRATKVDIDYVKTSRNKFKGPRSKLFWFGTHQLPTNGMLFLGDMEKMTRPLPFLQLNQELVQHDFAYGIRRSPAALRSRASASRCSPTKQPERWESRYQRCLASNVATSTLVPISNFGLVCSFIDSDG